MWWWKYWLHQDKDDFRRVLLLICYSRLTENPYHRLHPCQLLAWRPLWGGLRLSHCIKFQVIVLTFMKQTANSYMDFSFDFALYLSIYWSFSLNSNLCFRSAWLLCWSVLRLSKQEVVVTILLVLGCYITSNKNINYLVTWYHNWYERPQAHYIAVSTILKKYVCYVSLWWLILCSFSDIIYCCCQCLNCILMVLFMYYLNLVWYSPCL